MRDYYYKIDEAGNVTPCRSGGGMMDEWIDNLEKNKRVASTKIAGLHVSTVFLGMDHNWSGGTPILFETMVFGASDGSEWEQYQERYTTKVEALKGHEKIVEEIRYHILNVPISEFDAKYEG